MRHRPSIAFLALALATGCAADSGRADATGRSGGPTFEAWRDGLEREPGPHGVWIVDGDHPIATEKRLRDRWERRTREDGLAIAVIQGRDAVWGSGQKHDLTYCVSREFGARHGEVVAAMAEAAAAWMAVADVGFAHVPEVDGRCDGADDAVLFDVRPGAGGTYLARAFYPFNARPHRVVRINEPSFGVRAPLSLAGILRHELGHVLGFGHEHARAEARGCDEARELSAVTDYDAASVMHYPHCAGGGNHAMTISPLDAEGAAAVYGPPGAGADAPRTAPVGTPYSGSASGSVPAGRAVRLAPFAVLPGSDFRATLSGEGDADLYLRFGAPPTEDAYDCRPFAETSDERCDQVVPEGLTEAHLLIRGRTDATFEIALEWMGPMR